MSATHPYVRYAVAKAVKKGEDCCLCLPTQQWPAGHTGGAGGPPPRTYGLYAVIDGHNGPAAAEFTTARLPGMFSIELSRSLKVYDGARDEAVAAALGATFLGLDQQFCKQAQLSGCTCTVAVLVGWTLSVANIGDSRAILDTGAPEVLQLTYDFRLEDSPAERARVVAAGATLRRLAATGAGPCGPDEVGHGPLRVWPGGLALSRAIGDADVGPCIVAAPFVKQLRLPPTGGTRIIIASDGVWDAIGNMAAAKPVRKVGVEEAASAVVAAALRLRGLRDDTTVVVVDLCPSSKPLPEFLEEAAAAAKAEQRLAKSNGSAGDLAALEARPSRGGMAALLCGLCGSPAEDDERSARKSVHLPGIEELRELDFHSLMPARRGDVFVLPQIMPRSSGRLSSRSSTNGGMSDPTLAALTGADMPGLYPSAAAAAASSGLASHRAPGGEPQPLTAEGEWLPAEGSNDKASGTAGAAATSSGASGHRGGQRGSTGSSTSDPTEHAGRMYGPGGGDGSGLPPLLRSKYPSSSTNLSGASGAGSVGSDAEGDGSVSKSKGKAAVPLGTVHEQRPAAKGGAGPAAGGSAAAVGPPLTQGAEDASQRIMRLQAEAESRLHGKGGTHHWGDASDRDIEQLRSAHQEAVQMAPPPMAPADASQ